MIAIEVRKNDSMVGSIRGWLGIGYRNDCFVVVSSTFLGLLKRREHTGAFDWWWRPQLWFSSYVRNKSVSQFVVTPAVVVVALLLLCFLDRCYSIDACTSLLLRISMIACCICWLRKGRDGARDRWVFREATIIQQTKQYVASHKEGRQLCIRRFPGTSFNWMIARSWLKTKRFFPRKYELLHVH